MLTTHVCHPSLANDNVSGIAMLTELGVALAELPRRYSYRLLFIPGTIGSVTWLARNEDRLSRVIGGLVIACVGNAAPLTYKRSRRGETPIDWAGAHVVASDAEDGSSNSSVGLGRASVQLAGLRHPGRLLTRSLEDEFAEYHSSADDLDLISADRLEAAAQAALGIVEAINITGPTGTSCQEASRNWGSAACRGRRRKPRNRAAGDPLGAEPVYGSNTLLDIADRPGISRHSARSRCALRSGLAR